MNILLDTGTHKIESAGTVAAPVVEYKITPNAFKRRMTTAERIGIRTAAASSAEIFDFMDLLDTATYVDFEDAETITGLNTLEGAGLLGAGRAAEILGAPILDNERS